MSCEFVLGIFLGILLGWLLFKLFLWGIKREEIEC